MIYETIYKKLYRLVPTLDSIEVGNAVTLKADGFMDLHVDVLSKGKTQHEGISYTRIALSHDYKNPSGDMIPDPDMEIQVYHDSKQRVGMAEALTYQDSFGYQAVYVQAVSIRDTFHPDGEGTPDAG